MVWKYQKVASNRGLFRSPRWETQLLECFGLFLPLGFMKTKDRGTMDHNVVRGSQPLGTWSGVKLRSGGES